MKSLYISFQSTEHRVAAEPLFTTEVITLRERGNSDPDNPTFSGVSERNTRIVSLSLQINTE